MTSPLQLEDHNLVEVFMRTHPRWRESEEPSAYNAILQVRGETLSILGEKEPPYTRLDIATYFVEDGQENDILTARILLSLDINGTKEDKAVTPYSLRVSVLGTFRAYSFPPVGDEKRSETLNIVRANGAGLLYGIARHVVTELTLQSPYRQLAVPSLNFRNVIEREIALEVDDEPDDETPSVAE